MKLYIDRSSAELLTTEVRVKLGTRIRLDLVFTEGGRPVALKSDATGRLAAKSALVDATYSLDTPSWTPGASAGVYTFIVNVDDPSLIARFTDQPELTFVAEIEWREGGCIYKTPTFRLIVQNRVITE
ncbi:hypothetical protein DB346_05550 [Verrucomicrobia bacterium LW23]|nr:hypothetical protein DB346_05550 [Verrucomicrobia bacterium LW23]